MPEIRWSSAGLKMIDCPEEDDTHVVLAQSGKRGDLAVGEASGEFEGEEVTLFVFQVLNCSEQVLDFGVSDDFCLDLTLQAAFLSGERL